MTARRCFRICMRGGMRGDFCPVNCGYVGGIGSAARRRQQKEEPSRAHVGRALPALLRAKRAAAIYIDHVRVGTRKRLVLVRTSSEQEAQHEECRSNEYQPRLDCDPISQRAARSVGEGGRFVHLKPTPWHTIQYRHFSKEHRFEFVMRRMPGIGNRSKLALMPQRRHRAAGFAAMLPLEDRIRL
jgi:hypothetical protein